MSSYGNEAITQLTNIAAAMNGSAEIRILPTTCLLAATGAPLAVFANGVSTTPGVQITNSKTWCVRWNNDAAPAAIATTVPVPYDLDPSYPITILAACSKIGATAADVASLTIAAYLAKDGQVHDVDSDFGGASSAIPAATATKTVVTLTRTLAASDITAALGSTPIGSTQSAFLSLSFTVTAGTLGTDDFCLHSITLRYTRKKPSA